MVTSRGVGERERAIDLHAELAACATLQHVADHRTNAGVLGQDRATTSRSRLPPTGPCYRDFASGPFYGFNRPGVESSEAIIENWWRQGMMGGAKAHYDGIVAFPRPISPRTSRRSPCPSW
jgi:hypothetical protein